MEPVVVLLAVLLVAALALTVLFLRLGVQTLRSTEWPKARWMRLLIGWSSIAISVYIFLMALTIAGPF